MEMLEFDTFKKMRNLSQLFEALPPIRQAKVQFPKNTFFFRFFVTVHQCKRGLSINRSPTS